MKSNLLKVYFLAYSDLVKNVPNASLQKLRVVALYKLTIMQMELRQFNCNLIQFLRNYSAKEYEASRVKRTGAATKKPVSVVEQIREQAAEVVQSEEPSAYLAPLDPRTRSNRQETITGMMVRAVKKGEFDPRSCENPARNTIYNYLYTEPNTPSKRASASKGQAPSFSHPETVPVQLPAQADTLVDSSRTKKKIDKSIPEETKGEIELPVFRYKRMVIAEPEPEHIHHKVKPQIVMDTSSIRSVQIQVSYLDSPVLEKLPTAQFFDPQSPKNYLIPCPRSYR